MTTTTKVPDRLRRILVRELGLESDAPLYPATMLEELGADSLDLVEIAMEMEKEYGVNVNELAWNAPVRVSDLLDSIKDAANV